MIPDFQTAMLQLLQKRMTVKDIIKICKIDTDYFVEE